MKSEEVKNEPMLNAQKEVKDIIEDYFYEKTKDFVFNYYEEDYKRRELQDLVNDCVEEVFDNIRYYTKEVDEFLENYEFYREENMKEYEYNIKYS